MIVTRGGALGAVVPLSRSLMSKSVWRHLGLLSMLSFFPGLWGFSSQFRREMPELGWGPALHAAGLHTLGSGLLGYYLAIAAGIAVGTGALGKRSVRTALAVLAVTTLAMIVLDVVIEPAATRASKEAARTAARSPATAWHGFFSDTIIWNRADTLGDLRTGIQLLRDNPAALREPLGESWSQDNPRSLAERASVFAPTLLLPFIGIGLMLGIVAWVRQHATFGRPRDETIAAWVLAWVVVPAACSFIRDWSSRSGYTALHTRDYWLPSHIYVPFLVIAALGWREAARNQGGQVGSAS
jgi:hypothetical protein